MDLQESFKFNSLTTQPWKKTNYKQEILDKRQLDGG